MSDTREGIDRAKQAREIASEIMDGSKVPITGANRFIVGDLLESMFFALEAVAAREAYESSTGFTLNAGERIAFEVAHKLTLKSVGPALARLESLEKMEQRLKACRGHIVAGSDDTYAYILTGSDAKKGKSE